MGTNRKAKSEWQHLFWAIEVEGGKRQWNSRHKKAPSHQYKEVGLISSNK